MCYCWFYMTIYVPKWNEIHWLDIGNKTIQTVWIESVNHKISWFRLILTVSFSLNRSFIQIINYFPRKINRVFKHLTNTAWNWFRFYGNNGSNFIFIDYYEIFTEKCSIMHTIIVILCLALNNLGCSQRNSYKHTKIPQHNRIELAPYIFGNMERSWLRTVIQ